MGISQYESWHEVSKFFTPGESCFLFLFFFLTIYIYNKALSLLFPFLFPFMIGWLHFPQLPCSREKENWEGMGCFSCWGHFQLGLVLIFLKE